MSFESSIILISLALLVGMALAMEAGRRIGLARVARDSDGHAKGGGGAAEGAVFGLFGLLLAFTFSGASGRFEDRRDLITQEANAIGTVWLRLGVLPRIVLSKALLPCLRQRAPSPVRSGAAQRRPIAVSATA